MFAIKNLNIRDITTEPGVYIFYNAQKKPIYVGKAKSLRNRVSSYFVSKGLLEPKTRSMLEEAVYIRFIPTQSEVEAFLLEADLIKQFKPKYNIQLKDDKSYVHILFQRVKVNSQESFTKVFVGRLTGRRKKDENIIAAVGPFVEAKTTRDVLKTLRKIYPFASCSKTKFLEHRKIGRPCLYGQIGLCPAPCVNSNGQKINQQNIKKLQNFIKHGRNRIVKQLESKMRKLSKELRFEEAIEVREELERLNSLNIAKILPDQYQENPNLIFDIYQKRMADIKEMFKLDRLPRRIECYDISNLMGEWAVASMVVSEEGKLAKHAYKRFRIKFTTGITDFGMMAEVLLRRARKDWPKPDILLIDGGKGQVSSVLKAIQGTPLENTLVVGIFKPNDFFVINRENYVKVLGHDLDVGTALATGWYVIRPKSSSLGYEHLRELRDEAHRFAKAYHKKLRSLGT